MLLSLHELIVFVFTFSGAGFTLPTAIWIGLYWIDVTGLGNYVHFWEKSGQLEELTWSYWDSTEPNNEGSEQCVRIHTNMFMRTIDCGGSYDILCEGTGWFCLFVCLFWFVILFACLFVLVCLFLFCFLFLFFLFCFVLLGLNC